MDEHKALAEQFEANRARLQALAYRMLGSLSDADDAVQEAWLRLSRTDAGEIGNIGGWLTTVVSRVCLDFLRSRKARREESMEVHAAKQAADRKAGGDPEQEALLADSIGLAMLVVLGTLNPAERIAFVLHDVFAVPFEEIAPIVGRNEAAARKLASRARRRVQGAKTASKANLGMQRSLVDSFLAAARAGDIDSLLKVLAPDVVLRDDRAAAGDASGEVRGSEDVARRLTYGRAKAARAVLVNGDVGIVIAPRGQLMIVLALTYADGKIVRIDQIADPARLGQLELAVLSE
ncbi:sigma-70 family RNA polymerase sigma factor [Cohnella zeiphila]|uniref:Sigma-70 family RNA polymerase sigma factor n=1 Tax=Cohnella zeiphila TaxID=2761120 RepID=A0A7X0SSM9_9BACL|nr:sigma-70 family RNA polymerase sigma factor [Cohnella zeiphila]MBB6735387.1 sigma-70 family RNA polymerase sigma factor [Cohnella zeiphila]